MAVNSSLKKRREAAAWIVNKPHYVRETLLWCFVPESELLAKASWVLEIICETKEDVFYKYMHLFFEQLPNIKDDSALRSCAKICQMLCHRDDMLEFTYFGNILNKNERKIITACCFDWLLTDRKAACQASAMTCLYHLGSKKAWIYPELKSILIVNIPHKSAGYVARAKKILKKID